jgi:hypothetical protein
VRPSSKTIATAVLAPAAFFAFVSVAEAASARPSVVTIHAAPQVLSNDGGSVVVRVRVRNAQRCIFEGQRAASAPLSVVRTMLCGSGQASARIAVGANPSEGVSTVRFRVTARSAGGRSAVKSISVTQAAAPSPPASTLRLSAAALPSASVRTAYSTALVAAGGSPPYAWSIASGSLPPGLSLSSDGSIAGTPTSGGEWAFTVSVNDSAGQTASAKFVIAVTAAAIPNLTSSNWSGYALLGGPFTSATGTFSVPSIYKTPTDTMTAEWVGIDGVSSSDPGIIQAGVSEAYLASTNKYSVFAWVELFPAPSFNIPLVVTPGEQITVTISQVSAGVWSVYMKNNSTGQTYSINENYSGRALSAEWIVEAPGAAATGLTYTLGDYSPVTFSQVGVNPVAGALARIMMVQNGTTVSTPSDITANGFTVAYGAVTPAAP